MIVTTCDRGIFVAKGNGPVMKHVADFGFHNFIYVGF